MIKLENYLNNCKNILDEYKVQYDNKKDLMDAYKEAIQVLRKEGIIHDVETLENIANRLSSFAINRIKGFEYVQAIFNKKHCNEYFETGDFTALAEVLTKQYNSIVDYIDKKYTQKKNTYKTHIYRAFESRYVAKMEVVAFAELMGIELEYSELTDWNEPIFENDAIKLKVYKNDNVEITIK